MCHYNLVTALLTALVYISDGYVFPSQEPSAYLLSLDNQIAVKLNDLIKQDKKQGQKRFIYSEDAYKPKT